MELLAELTEKMLGISEERYAGKRFKVRKAARAVVIDKDKVAIISVKKHQFYKIPGGGIEEGEDIKEALHREVAEEAGVEIDIKQPIGSIIEYRKQHDLIQISYCYLATVKKILPGTAFTKKETNDGFELRWIPIKEAWQLFDEAHPDEYASKFMNARDQLFFQKGTALISSWE